MTAPFDGKTFHNIGTVEDRSFKDVMRWQLTKQTAKWPRQVPLATSTKPDTRVDGLRVTMVNHATLLIQMDGQNILTDPVWSERVSPLSFAGPRRCTPPGIALADLPRIDAVLLSHDHYDHCDIVTLRKIGKIHQPLVLTGLAMAPVVRSAEIERVVELDWWQSHAVADTTVTFAPAQHWSSRSPASRNTRLWGSFFLRSSKRSAYFAADTGFGPHFAMVRDRLGESDIAMIPIGAYEPRWFMQPQHMNPAEAARAHMILGSRRSVGIHWGTFQLTDEPRDAPPAALAATGIAGFTAAENGSVFEHEQDEAAL
ncbi:MAG: MBL fold metallo-hydrolase [Clostridia bacterium]|nr:MBL fold metallo-hydrolase [Deltaproteobacteria bacterium]